MLRASLSRSRAIAAGAVGPRTGAQWLQVQRPVTGGFGQRYFADAKKTDETALPDGAPKTPPKPEEVGSTRNIPPTGTGSASTGPAAVPPPPPKKKRRFRRFFYMLVLLTTLGYGGGVYCSLISDNFHDFFTEYVPYGEDAVGYFEEREFRKRFHEKFNKPAHLHEQVRGEPKVNIPSKSGVSWRVAEDEKNKNAGSDLGVKGKHSSAVDDSKAAKAQPAPATATAAEKDKTVQAEKKEEKPTDSHTHQMLPKHNTGREGPKSEPAAKPKEEPLVDHLKIEGAEVPVVQDVVAILNNIITTINADDAQGKYSAVIAKAKEDLGKTVKDINTLKTMASKAAEDKIKASHTEFDNAAKELIRRLEEEMRDQEARWKEEYESEREKLSSSYQNKLNSELEAAEKLYDQKLKNELLEQSIKLQRSFADSIKDRVEKERNGRLARLNELSDSVQELEKLTGQWNEVVDANLKTQHLIVAVEAVKATLKSSDRPKPFIEELAALKEIASDDPVVNAAIASINPAAYQKGIPTPAQVIDRFRRVASEVRKAALLPEDAGVASHAASVVLSKLMFQKKGLPTGSDVESVLARTEALLEEGDLDNAAREMNGLQGWAKVLAGDWLSEVRRVLEVKQAMDVIATEARLQSLLVD